jgi:enoyl-CoA hydratase
MAPGKTFFLDRIYWPGKSVMRGLEFNVLSVHREVRGSILVVTIDRVDRRNAVDPDTAAALVEAFQEFEADESQAVAVLTGAGGTFCSGADLKALAAGRSLRVAEEGDGPMGPTRMLLSKPVIAAVEGHAVAGGFELALWCDMRVAGSDAIFGVFNRRFGVPLIDMGTVRLPRMIGHGRALDLILTGRAVDAEEALRIGIVNRVTDPCGALDAALRIATELASFPQNALRNDRLSAYEQWGMSETDAILNELRRGRASIASGEAEAGALRFSEGAGRHGSQQ